MSQPIHSSKLFTSRSANIALIGLVIGIVNLAYGLTKEDEYINTKANYPHLHLRDKYIEEVDQKIEFYRLIRVGGSAIAFLSLSSFLALQIIKPSSFK